MYIPRTCLVAYSCENILAEAGMSTQSGPPVPPRAASSDDLYALPRSFSCGVLATRLRNLDPSNIYYGDDTQFKTEDEGIMSLPVSVFRSLVFLY